MRRCFTLNIKKRGHSELWVFQISIIFQFESHRLHSIHFRCVNVVGEDSGNSNATHSICMAGYHYRVIEKIGDFYFIFFWFERTDP